MNKFKLFSVICLCVGIALSHLYCNQTEEYSDIVLSNVEALASDSEGDFERKECILEGGVKCKHGGYAKYIVTGVVDNWELF